VVARGEKGKWNKGEKEKKVGIAIKLVVANLM